MDPFSLACSFQNLLNSQQPNNYFSYVPREASVEFSSSDASVFGTQWAEDADEDEHTVEQDVSGHQLKTLFSSVPG